jgi:hypothetical protein
MMRACPNPTLPAMRLPVVLSLALTATSLVGEASAAGDKLRLGIFGNGKGTGPLLTRAELRECLTLQERVRSGSEVAVRDRDQLEQEKSALMRDREDIKAALERLDLANAEAVEQHKARAKAHDLAIQDFSARSDAFNGRIGSLESDRAGFKQRCDNRRFDLVDEEAIRKGK